MDSIVPKISPSNNFSNQKPNKVSLITVQSRTKKSKVKSFLKITITVILSVIFILGFFTINRAMNLSDKIFVGQKTSFFQKVKDVLRGGTGGVRLIGENLGQINILLLGIGGEGHEGPYLSDTMILAQIRPSTGEIALISIPRDFWAKMPENLGYEKINSAFALGFQKNKDWNTAGTFARKAVENISGLNIPYFAVVDFSGFEKAVNQVGGLDIYVERTFTDAQYPDNKYGYLAPVTFEQGWEHMDGTRALQFARSRHAAGIEGSDFSRSQRQQKIMKAFKNKIISLNLITNANKINDLAETFADHFHTNISPGEIFRTYALTKDRSFFTLSLDPETKIICPKIMEETGAYVLTACEGKSDSDVKNFFKNVFTLGKIYDEKSVIWMAKSKEEGQTAYTEAGVKLTAASLTVWELPYGGDPLPYTIFYQVNPKPATAEFIKNTLGAKEVNLPPPGVKIDKEKVDIIVILGE